MDWQTFSKAEKVQAAAAYKILELLDKTHETSILFGSDCPCGHVLNYHLERTQHATQNDLDPKHDNLFLKNTTKLSIRC